ncbi:hypothetical protein Hanom_Chr05g00402211 [Helianthus anomalus]
MNLEGYIILRGICDPSMDFSPIDGLSDSLSDPSTKQDDPSTKGSVVGIYISMLCSLDTERFRD